MRRFKNKVLFSVAFAIVIVGLLVLGYKFNVFSADPTPEGRAFDQSMNSKNVYIPNEHGFITLKAYRVNISSGSTVPSQMNFYFKEQSGTQIGYDSIAGMGSVKATDVTKQDGVLKVPVSINSSDTGTYVSVKLSVQYTNAGIYDVLSNYAGCELGTLSKTSETSRVEYVNGSTDAIVRTDPLPALCIKVIKNSLQIVKTTYLDNTSAGVDIKNLSAVQGLTKTANFIAGDKVVVVLEIDEQDTSRSDFKVTDLLPIASQDIDYVFIAGGQVQNSAMSKISNYKANFYGGTPTSARSPVVGNLVQGKNYIIYRYKI